MDALGETCSLSQDGRGSQSGRWRGGEDEVRFGDWRMTETGPEGGAGGEP